MKPNSGGSRETHQVTVPGARVAVEVRGTGIPLLLVHGYPLNRHIWDGTVAHLTGARIILPDLRGFGESTAPEDDSDMRRYADDLLSVLDRLGIHRVVAGGLSMGGYVVFQLLRQAPDRIQGLVLVATRAGADTATGKAARTRAMETARSGGAAAIARAMVPQLLAPETLESRPETVQGLTTMIESAPVAGIVGALKAMRERPDSRDLLASHPELPALVLAGAADSLVPPEEAETLHRLLPRGSLRVIPGAGHLVPWERPEETARAIQDFLAGLAETGASSRP